MEQVAQVRRTQVEQATAMGRTEAGAAPGRIRRLLLPAGYFAARAQTRPDAGALACLAVETVRADGFLIRLLDIIGALAILIAALPVMIPVALVIKLTSPGPVFYRQERVGQGGRLFTLCKFRTMVNDAEKDLGPVWAKKDDDRVTPVGRLLRRMRIDELPQVYNVLRGDMSLVGPRPERPFFVERHQALQGVRLSVKPGITGLAQIRSYYDLKPAHKLKYDRLYIQNRSFWLNCIILLQTIPVLFGKMGW